MKEIRQIMCFGEILWDCLPGCTRPGGAPLNVAFHLNKLGVKSKIASCVGNDKAGKDLTEFIRKAGLDTNLVKINKHLPTSKVDVYLDKDNNAKFEICNPVAWDEIRITPELLTELNNSNAIVFGSLIARNKVSRETVLKLLIRKNLIKILDVNLRPPYDDKETVKILLEKADILKLNEEELITITNWYEVDGNIVRRMHALQKIYQFGTLIVTRGKDGAYLIHENVFFKHDGFMVNSIDTVGCGDAFLAGFLAALFDNKDMNQVLTEACSIGAFVATRVGATPEYTKDDIYSFVDKSF